MAIELSGNKDSAFLKMQRRQLTGDAKWKDIEDLINRWARRYPAEAVALEKYVKEVRAGLKNKKFGADRDKNAMGRMGIAIFPSLEAYIKAFYPDFLNNKDDLHEFMKRFPKFKVPEKV